MSAQEAAKLLNYAFLLFPPMVAVFLICNVFYLKRMREILSGLEQRHPAVWEELGKPSLFKNNTPANGLNVLRFLYRRAFLRLGDEALAVKCESVRRLLLILVIAEGAGMVLFLVMFVLGSLLKA